MVDIGFGKYYDRNIEGIIKAFVKNHQLFIQPTVLNKRTTLVPSFLYLCVYDMKHKQKLFFVYNGDSSLVSRAKDYVHKTMSPGTYACNLCSITYGRLGMKSEWKEFIKKLPYAVTFLHRDELRKQYPELAGVQLPAIFQTQHGQITECISAAEIRAQKTVEDLQNLVLEKINIYNKSVEKNT
jgi:hypothetical protein